VDPLTALTTFAAVFPAELPDKTMVASMVLATRFRHPWAVWAGASAAFVVHVTVAVLAGSVLAMLPTRPVQVVVAGLFALGAVMLWREGGDVDDADEDAADARIGLGWFAVARRAFLVVFLAEWGDLTQLATASMSASTGEPWSVFVGALLALSAVAAIAVVAGRTILRFLPVKVVRRAAALLFAGLAVFTLVEALRG
jgi:putative Ca2+/H+ antiporter (TMEM165/GDT1 family)